MPNDSNTLNAIYEKIKNYSWVVSRKCQKIKISHGYLFSSYNLKMVKVQIFNPSYSTLSFLMNIIKYK